MRKGEREDIRDQHTATQPAMEEEGKKGGTEQRTVKVEAKRKIDGII